MPGYHRTRPGSGRRTGVLDHGVRARDRAPRAVDSRQGRFHRLGDLLLACLTTQEVEDDADRDDDEQRHDLAELVLQPLVGEAERVETVVGVPARAEAVDAEPGP